jgi:hypothetical protein
MTRAISTRDTVPAARGRDISSIAIHCSASPNGRSLFSGKPGLPAALATPRPGFVTPVQEINAWHRARGFQRRPQFLQRQNPALCCIGYHFVIYTNGALATGRHIQEIGAHVEGFNAQSLGICLVGTDRFSPEQWVQLKATVESLLKTYPAARVLGHRDYPEVHKTCPGFDVAAWLAGGMAPLDGHTISQGLQPLENRSPLAGHTISQGLQPLENRSPLAGLTVGGAHPTHSGASE